MKIPITKPYFGPEESQAIQKPLESGWVVQGPCVQAFEEAFAAYTDAPYAVATSNCTSALHIAVAIMNLKPGDEVIVPAFTWVSTANVVEYMGAKPVFCDIDLETYNIDAGQIEALITPRTVGILPVHLFGLCADMKPIQEIAQRHGLWIVEDAACALGALIDGQHAGTFGQAGCFSFHPRKSISTGEGGMLITTESWIDPKARILREHGADRTDLSRHHSAYGFLLPEFHELGFNYRMTDLQGAVGVEQMKRVDWILEQRSRIADRYHDALQKIEWLRLPTVPAHHQHGYQSFVVLYAPESPSLANVDWLHHQRNEFMQALDEQGIMSRQGTHAVTMTGYYREKYGLEAGSFPNAWLADRLSLALPLYPQMTLEEHQYVCDHIQLWLPKSFA